MKTSTKVSHLVLALLSLFIGYKTFMVEDYELLTRAALVGINVMISAYLVGLVVKAPKGEVQKKS